MRLISFCYLYCCVFFFSLSVYLFPFSRMPCSFSFSSGYVQAKMAQHGLRNSLLLAPMPTASTAQILGNNESTEPFTRCEIPTMYFVCIIFCCPPHPPHPAITAHLHSNDITYRHRCCPPSLFCFLVLLHPLHFPSSCQRTLPGICSCCEPTV